MSNKYSGFPTVLKRGNGASPEVFTEIAGIMDPPLPASDTTIIDSTTMDNPNAFKTKLAGLIDAGSATFTLALDPADSGQQNIQIDMVDRTLRDWQVVLPDTGETVIAFTAFVKTFKMKAPINGLLTADCALELSGKPTFGTYA
jgi:predicted secreted protein